MKKFFAILAGVVVVVFVWAALRSDEKAVSREILVRAPVSQIFPMINNAKKSYSWMPWTESDPTAQVQFSGPEEGVGAKSSWTGDKMGVGQSEVIESNTNQNVKTQLTYQKPFEMSQLADVSLTSDGDSTRVRWSVSGKQNFFFRLIGIFVSCDKMIGPEFEKGLSRLKILVENNVEQDVHSH